MAIQGKIAENCLPKSSGKCGPATRVQISACLTRLVAADYCRPPSSSSSSSPCRSMLFVSRRSPWLTLDALNAARARNVTSTRN
ncbi:hypothetical protein FIBSPDRAFT_866099, partial [Athelia psychrophila]